MCISCKGKDSIYLSKIHPESDYCTFSLWTTLVRATHFSPLNKHVGSLPSPVHSCSISKTALHPAAREVFLKSGLNQVFLLLKFFHCFPFPREQRSKLLATVPRAPHSCPLPPADLHPPSFPLLTVSRMQRPTGF